MFIVISYDIDTTTVAGKRRLSKAAKICLRYGQRVQNSVYECQLDALHLAQLKSEILKLLNLETDSLRIYNFGNTKREKVEHYGQKSIPDPTKPLII